MSAPPLIEADGLTKTFVTGEVSFHALREVSLEIAEGEYVAVIGASGSGKSTLLNILGCLDTPTAGSYRLKGEEISRKDDIELARIRNRTFGFVFQSFNLLGRYSALDNVALPMVYGGVSKTERRERAAAILKRLGLGNFLGHCPGKLSGGMQQRVAIARALVNAPDILFADEPTGNLDSRTGGEIIDLFGELNGEGKTIIVVTHDPRVAEHAPRTIRIEDGRIA